MVKICGRLKLKDKIISTYVFELDEDFQISEFEHYVADICYNLDIPNPITLVKHVKNFMLFNSTTYLKDDFVEKIFFDKLELVNEA
ncbi:MAG: hypothetical protein E7361_04745 [Clostridiales bacterium]|nr:hypothetical protein [Clostridiales bacterium]